jgi:hypothetical protein
MDMFSLRYLAGNQSEAGGGFVHRRIARSFGIGSVRPMARAGTLTSHYLSFLLKLNYEFADFVIGLPGYARRVDSGNFMLRPHSASLA